MRGDRTLSCRWTRIGFAVSVVVVAVVVMTAPAFADPAVTSWSLSPKSQIITYGQVAYLTGQMKSGGVAIPGLWVDFGQGTTQTGSFEVIYKITTPQAAESTKYAVGVKPLQNTYYRFQWAGDVTYAASNSDVVPVQVMPALGAPGNGTSITVGKKLSVKGSVTPGTPGAPTVQIKAYRQKGDGSWTGYKTYSAKVSGTDYSQSITMSQTGKFRFKVVSVASAKFAAGESGYGKVLTVKK